VRRCNEERTITTASIRAARNSIVFAPPSIGREFALRRRLRARQVEHERHIRACVQAAAAGRGERCKAAC
jgi:hypothetical protein